MKKILYSLTLLILSAGICRAEGKIWAVLVGINGYENAAQLQYCANDVTRFRDLLLRAGASNNRVLLMADSAATKNCIPTYTNCLKMIRIWFADNQISPEDTFYFYFSGHGVRVDDKDYLMPMDASTSDITETGYPLDKLYSLARQCKAGRVILILDACRDVTGGKAGGSDNQFGADAKRFTVEARTQASSKTIVTIQSCSPEEISWEMPDKQQGVFSYYLLEGLGPKSKRKLSELSEYLSEEVPAWARKSGKPKSQTPVVNMSSEKWEDLALLPSLSTSELTLSPTPAPSESVTPSIASSPTPTPMPIPSSPSRGTTAVNPKDGAAMVWVPAGEFLMGSNDGASDEKPQRTVYLDGYWMYKYEVTVAQYRKFCHETGRKMPEAPDWGWKDDHPIVNVSWNDGKAYADWAGARLPSEAEWEKAARGTDGRMYPWGNKWDASKCMTTPLTSIRPVGSYDSGASPYGCMDMEGNAWEWCADWYDGGYYKIAPSRNPKGPSGGRYRVLRGGSYIFYKGSGFRCARRDHGYGPGSVYAGDGFRLAR